MAALSAGARVRAMLFGRGAAGGTKAGEAARRPTAFDAGRNARRLVVIPSSTRSINTDIAAFGERARARSRYLCTNDAYFVAAKRAYVAAMVGTGIMPAPRLQPKTLAAAFEEAFLDWTDEADAAWQTDFYGLQWKAAGEMFEAGEALFRIRPRRPQDGLSVPLQLQPIPAEMLPLEDTRRLSNGNLLHCGIEFDAIGRRLAYHFLRNHPGEIGITDFRGLERVRVPADNVLHLFEPLRDGQVRGVPQTLSAMVAGAMLGIYDDNELERKRTAAYYTVFVTRPIALNEDGLPLYPGAGTSATTDDGASHSVPADGINLEPGAVIELAEGEQVTPAQPADVGGSYEPFQYRQLTRIASGLGVPYADMTGDLRQTSFASVRAGLIQFRRRIASLQHHVMVFQMCRPVWRRWVETAVLAGALPVSPSAFMAEPGRYLRCAWRPPRWEWVDPLKDAQTVALLVDEKLMSRDAAIEEMGESPDQVDHEIAEGRARLAELGIPLDGGSSSATFSAGDGSAADESADFAGTPPDEPATARLNGSGRLHS